MYTLPETELIKLQMTSEDDRTGTYVIEPLSPGYGVTLGNSLRRVLFSSLEGSAVSAVQIEGVTHEFTTIPGMNEDVVGLILNLKTLRIKLLSDEPVIIHLEAKGPGKITAKHFTSNANVEIADPDHYLATLDKQGKLSLEVTVERGRGYVPTEQKKNEQRPLGTINVDSIFTPVKKVHYEVENTRVGGMTNFDKLTIDITTDGTIHPREALAQAARILVEHFTIITELEMPTTGKPSRRKVKADVTVSEDVVTDELSEVTTARAKLKKTASKAETEPKAKKNPKVK